jgi:hypothetical protein
MITADTDNVLEVLRDLHAPVRDWKVESGSDWSGDDAVWVWDIVDDDQLDHLSQDERADLRDRITNALKPNQYDSTPLVYIRFRAASEA